jgi:hypothetical protein
MQPVHDYLDSRYRTAVRLRRAAFIFVFVFVAGWLFLLADVAICAALIRFEVVDVPVAINFGLIIGIFGFWLLIAKIPYLPAPRQNPKDIAPSLLLCLLSAALSTFVSFSPTVPTSPPRFVSFAI